MINEEELQSLYENQLKPQLLIFENQRKKILNSLIPVSIGGLVLIILLLGVLLNFEISPLWQIVFFVGIIVILVGIGIYYYLLVSPYKNNFKKTVVGHIVSFIDENLLYRPEGKISQSEFEASRLADYLHSVDRWHGEDYVNGLLGKTAVKFSEVHAEYRTTHTDRNGHTRTSYHTIFKGLFFIFDFNKDFEGFTVVLPDYAERHFGGFGKMLQSWHSKIVPGELVKLADVEFEREFAVYSDNQITARYVLSTSLMRRLLNFRQQIKKRVYLSFVNGKLYMGIEIYKDLFEPTVFRTLLNFELIREFVSYMQLGKNIVEELNLNTRIWSKQ